MPGPVIAVAITCNERYCDLERRSTWGDGKMDGTIELYQICYQGGATPLILAAPTDRLDVLQGLVAGGADDLLLRKKQVRK